MRKQPGTNPEQSAYPVPQLNRASGLTKREYAAIHLGVPDSGSEWLDVMIRQSGLPLDGDD